MKEWERPQIRSNYSNSREGRASDSSWSMRRGTNVQDYLPIDSDIILGMQWLSTLGTVQVNWKPLEMKIALGKSAITLKGEEGLIGLTKINNQNFT